MTMGKDFIAFVLEALVAGFYVAITRGLAPIFFAIYGMDLAEILKINFVAHLVALVFAWVFYTLREVMLGGGLKLKLLLLHGFERLVWGSIPFVALYHPDLLYAVYSLAVVSTAPVGIMINVALNSSLDVDTVKRAQVYRTALGSVSTVVGQLVSIIVVASIEGAGKYVLLYAIAMGVGLVSTAVLSAASIGGFTPRESGEEEGVEAAKASTAFLFLTLIIASGAVLGVSWGPYLVSSLGAEEYIAVALGLAQTVTSVGASVFWTSRSYRVYRYAVAILPAVPLAITFARAPLLHIAIAALYSFANVGANLLASFIFAEAAKRYSIDKASAMLGSAFILAQVVGVGVAYLASAHGAHALFAVSSVFAGLSLAIAFLAIPEVAVAPPHLALIYAAQIHSSATTAYNLAISTARGYAILSAKILAFALALAILYTAFRLLYYFVQFLAGALP